MWSGGKITASSPYRKRRQSTPYKYPIDCKFGSPHKLAVNKVNQDLYICDRDAAFCLKGKLIAVGADGELRYEYTRREEGDQDFVPWDVCSDQMGHVLVVDYEHFRIHILSKEGWFLQWFVLTSEEGINRLWFINVDSDGYMWVGGWVYPRKGIDEGCVKVIKYIQ